MTGLKRLKYLLTGWIFASAWTACSVTEEVPPVVTPPSVEEPKEMVLFAAGTTEHRQSRATDGTTYYMPDAYHFVCRMYYMAQIGSDEFDVSGNTDQTAWLKVNGPVGNSLYWNSNYTPVGSNEGVGGVDSYGNDYSATAFYWQNRKEHAFLAWTDLNKATSITGGSSKGNLKFKEDLMYKVNTNQQNEQWVDIGYRIYGDDEHVFTSLTAMRDYVENNIKDIDAFKTQQQEIGNELDWSDVEYHYQFGWSCKYTLSNCGYTYADDKHRTYGWYQYMMFFDKTEYQEDISDLIPVKDNNGVVTKLKDPETGVYVAEAEVKKDADGNCLDSNGVITEDVNEYTYNYYETDEAGNVRYDESNPRYTYYFKRYQERKLVDVYDEFPALAFDLTRGSKTNMGQQPDIAQALEIQAPMGATQESNRVNLYFKHQFSQLQVNIKNAEDSSVSLLAEDIQKVELLGVSEEGYIFTELDKDGKVRAAAYKMIDFVKYSEQELKDNPYGTSFEMFKQTTPEYGYLQSFNAIAFGQLQAIRITWKEHDTEYTHAATYRIKETDLMNLKSGVRYVWNIEVRRGTLAIIRTEIVDWELPDDEDHNGNIIGTIDKTDTTS